MRRKHTLAVIVENRPRCTYSGNYSIVDGGVIILKVLAVGETEKPQYISYNHYGNG